MTITMVLRLCILASVSLLPPCAAIGLPPTSQRLPELEQPQNSAAPKVEEAVVVIEEVSPTPLPAQPPALAPSAGPTLAPQSRAAVAPAPAGDGSVGRAAAAAATTLGAGRSTLHLGHAGKDPATASASSTSPATPSIAAPPAPAPTPPFEEFSRAAPTAAPRPKEAAVGGRPLSAAEAALEPIGTGAARSQASRGATEGAPASAAAGGNGSAVAVPLREQTAAVATGLTAANDLLRRDVGLVQPEQHPAAAAAPPVAVAEAVAPAAAAGNATAGAALPSAGEDSDALAAAAAKAPAPCRVVATVAPREAGEVAPEGTAPHKWEPGYVAPEGLPPCPQPQAPEGSSGIATDYIAAAPWGAADTSSAPSREQGKMTGVVETATPWGQAAAPDLVQLKGAAAVEQAVPWGQADTSDTGDPIGAASGAAAPPAAPDLAAGGSVGGRITFSPRLAEGASSEAHLPHAPAQAADEKESSENAPISVSPVRALLALSSAWLLGCTCLLAGFCACSAMSRSSSSGAVRTYVEELPVCRSEEVQRRLPASGGYDCALSRPMSSRQLLRLEGLVGQPAAGNLLMAPLTQEPCVVYTSTASRALHDGVHPVPMAFASASIDFSVTLADDPLVRIEVSGEDVCLFEMCAGRYVDQRGLDQLPDSWSDFLTQHRTAPHLNALARPDGAVAEFQECKLAVGAVVTLVGELHRSANGVLSLRPQIQGTPTPLGGAPSWRTSWEAGGGAPAALSDGGLGAGTRIEKVLVSDDPGFLGNSKNFEMFPWGSQQRRFTSWTSHIIKRTFRRPPSPGTPNQAAARARGSPPPSPAAGPRTSTPVAGSELRARVYIERP